MRPDPTPDLAPLEAAGLTSARALEWSREVDDHPRALEILAARLRLLGEAEVARRRADPSFLCPIAPASGDPAATLNAEIEAWCAAHPELIAPAEALAAFAGSAPAEALEATLGGAPGEALSQLQALHAAGGLRGQGALRLHRPLWAWLRARGRVCAAAARRRWGWIAARAAALTDALVERGDEAAARALEAMAPELRALLEEGAEGAHAARVAAACALNAERGNGEEALTLRGILEGLSTEGLSAEEASRLRVHRARAARLTGDPRAARRHLEGHAPPEGEAAAAHAAESANVALGLRDFPAAERHLAEAIAWARRLEDPRREARCLLNEANLRYWQGRPEEALRLTRAAQALARRLEAARFERLAVTNRALMAAELGALDEAREAGARALTLAREAGDLHGEGAALNHLGILAFQVGDLEEAEARCAAAQVLHERTGLREQAGFSHLNLAEIALEREDLPAARAHLEAARALNEPLGAGVDTRPLDHPLIGAYLEHHRGHIARLSGDLGEATARWRAGLERLRGETSATLARLELWLSLGWWSGDAEGLAAAAEEARALGDEGWREAAALLGPAPRWSRALAGPGPSVRDHAGVRRAARWSWSRMTREARREAWACAVDPEARMTLFDAAERAVRPAGGAWISLTERDLLWRLLTCLAGRAGPASVEALTEALWPGERILPKAASNRVYNAVALLRRRGLGACLARGEAGYALSTPHASAPSLADLDAVLTAI